MINSIVFCIKKSFFLILKVEGRFYMKATGIIRRIDDLGRIVIPKEIRKNLKINKGDSLEIYVNEEEIILRKYSFFEDTLGIAKKLLTSFNKIYNKCLIVTDKEKVIASNNSNYVNRSINDSIKKSIENRVDVLGKNLFDINN